MNGNLKGALAELIGTFTLVLIGAGTGALAAKHGGVVAVALAHGICLSLIVYAWGSASGAHVNPAVTFGLLLTGKVDVVKAVLWWVAQFIGAALAGFLLKWLLEGLVAPGGEVLGLGETIGDLTKSSPLKTIVVEGILTAFLLFSIFGSAVAGRNGSAVGLAIGLTLTMDILMGATLTGASMNPARTFGPALAAGDMSYLWMYFVGPVAGAGVAAVLYNALFLHND